MYSSKNIFFSNYFWSTTGDFNFPELIFDFARFLVSFGNEWRCVGSGTFFNDNGVSYTIQKVTSGPEVTWTSDDIYSESKLII